MHGDISKALDSLARLISLRVRELESGTAPQPIEKLADPALITAFHAPVPGVLLDVTACVALAVAMAPQLAPHLFDESIAAALKSPADHPRIGGRRGSESRVFLPTLETVIFLLGIRDISDRLAVMRLFSDDHPFARQRLLRLAPGAAEEPVFTRGLIPGDDLLDSLLGLPSRRPSLGPEFPAQRIETTLEWNDLVLDPKTLAEIRELETWIRHGDTLLDDWGMAKYLKPGYRALFHGPSGTGKTLTASLLGKQTGRDVYRIDLSLVVSKFIGETEKNLARIFSKAEDRDWVLFFDEADALFGKRTSVRDAHDRYANQEVSYLLQRLEAFDGLVILASNLRNNIDEAFLRRFQSVIHFPKPTAEERLRMWKRMLPDQATLPQSLNLPVLCKRHELTGAAIAGVIQYACLQALDRHQTTLDIRDIELAIAREYEKEGRLG